MQHEMEVGRERLSLMLMLMLMLMLVLGIKDMDYYYCDYLFDFVDIFWHWVKNGLFVGYYSRLVRDSY